MADGAAVASGANAPPSSTAAAPDQPAAVYCSTAGTYFVDKESLAEHYRSDFHRYNLKRKVAGLPPVTKEWFEARRAQLLQQQQQQQQQQRSGGGGGGGAPASSSASALPSAGDALLLPGGGAVPAAGDDRVWYDPLTRRRFYSENTYVAHTRSRKYAELVKKSGADAAPPPVVSRRAPVAVAAAAAAGSAPAAGEGPGAVEAGKRPRHRRAAPRGEAAVAGGFVVKPAAGTDAARLMASEAAAAAADAGGGMADDADGDEGGEEEEGSGWETASMDEEEGGEEEAGGSEAGGDDEAARWAEADAWDPRRSLFDGRVAPTLEDNLEHMWRRYGFVVPDVEACADPEGLLRYLGAKLAVGRVPLYARGDDATARRFRSLHAVQRHMVDSGRCRALYDGNEEEYEDFYDYGRLAQAQEGEGEGEGAEAMEGDGAIVAASAQGGARGKAAPAALAPPAGTGAAGELLVPGAPSSGQRALVLGTRALSRYYRQRARPDPSARDSFATALVVARYRALGVETLAKAARREAAIRARGGAGVKSSQREARTRLMVSMRANVNTDLPKNVPY